MSSNPDPAATLRALWYPRETAPQDGSVFRAYGPTLVHPDFNPLGQVEACFDAERFIGAVWDGQFDRWNAVPIEFTHWQPFPASPTEAAPARETPEPSGDRPQDDAARIQALIVRIANAEYYKVRHRLASELAALSTAASYRHIRANVLALRGSVRLDGTARTEREAFDEVIAFCRGWAEKAEAET